MTTTHSRRPRPDSDDAFMFYALAEGKIDTGDLRYVHELPDIEIAQPARPGRRARGDRRSRSTPTPTWPTATPCSSQRLLHGRRLRSPAGLAAPRRRRSARRRSQGRRVGVPGHDDDGVPRAPALPARRRAGGDALRPDRGCGRRGATSDVGLLIHEGQLTFADRGLHLWEDMGDWWLRDTGLPLAAGRQRGAARPGPEIVSTGRAGPPRQHRVRAGAPGAGAGATRASTAAASATSAPIASSGCT